MPATVGIALANVGADGVASRCAAATATAGGVHDAADERSGPEHGGEHLPGEGVEGDDGTTLGFVVLICWFDEGGGTGQSEVAGVFFGNFKAKKTRCAVKKMEEEAGRRGLGGKLTGPRPRRRACPCRRCPANT